MLFDFIVDVFPRNALSPIALGFSGLQVEPEIAGNFIGQQFRNLVFGCKAPPSRHLLNSVIDNLIYYGAGE